MAYRLPKADEDARPSKHGFYGCEDVYCDSTLNKRPGKFAVGRVRANRKGMLLGIALIMLLLWLLGMITATGCMDFFTCS